MIYATISQLNCWLTFLVLGFIFGIIFNLISIVFCLKSGKKLIKIIFECIFYSIFAIIFDFFINFFNFGKFSITLLAATILGFLYLRKLGENLVVFLESIWYTKLNKRKRKSLVKHESDIKS